MLVWKKVQVSQMASKAAFAVPGRARPSTQFDELTASERGPVKL